METLKVITASPSEWIDSTVQQPPNGSRVQCLNHGGVQVSAIWTSETASWADCWMPHVKVPQHIKRRQLERFMLQCNATEGHP